MASKRPHQTASKQRAQAPAFIGACFWFRSPSVEKEATDLSVAQKGGRRAEICSLERGIAVCVEATLEDTARNVGSVRDLDVYNQ